MKLSQRLRAVNGELFTLGFDGWSDDVEQAAIIVAIVESLPSIEDPRNAVDELKKLAVVFETR